MASRFFVYNERLGISIPKNTIDWEGVSTVEQQQILFLWEENRGKIPDRIKEIEMEINRKQTLLDEEDDFPNSCIINSEIADLASSINELWLWYRFEPSLSVPLK
ncbi:hypothetical protein [Bacillus testis]|uniref:hypothetical protein n=1 Tax=Bacillus testis TaxID=1622072 RepID=UPI00067F07CC|nr:hypothetical protein [Bacillus testis]